MKRIVSKSVAMLLVCIFSFTVALASEVTNLNEVRASDYLSSYDSWLTASGNGEIIISFSVMAVRPMDSVGASQIVVQKKLSENSWLGVETYYADTTSNLMAYSVARHGSTVTFNGAPGTEYRAMVAFYAGNSNGSDTKVFYTSSVVAA